MVSIKALVGRSALVAGALVVCAAVPVFADVSECIEACRQQVCADREACEDLLEQLRASAEQEAQACAASFPAQSQQYRACMKQISKARTKTSSEYRRCINLANTTGAACARSCAASPNKPFPVPMPGPFQICP
ncbi:MAG: hypothetical protein MUC67_08800 [Acidobacteria bacterium]|jgi:hypothetical protein|nr:hypothetical protein [Acidobacteriota bacterium]